MNTGLDNLLLHPKTRLQVEYILKNPPQALLISSSFGSGKKTLARNIATTLLELKDSEALSSYPYFFHIARLKNKSDISIEQIREVINALKLKTPGDKTIRRVVAIENAHFMSIPAQNALLKILEEPNPDTVFLLTATSAMNVLPTIASRTQKIELHAIGLKDSLNYWKDSGHSQQAIESAWRLSGGYAGLLNALLSEDKEHSLKVAVDEVKNFLKSSKYQRLLFADKLSRNKENLTLFLEAFSRTLSFLHHAAIKSDKRIQANNILLSRKISKDTSEALEANANTRLAMLKLVLNIKI
jgi:DNA polymerase-3 subunit delta'